MDDATAALFLSLDLGGESPGRPRWHARAACRGVGTDVFFVDTRFNGADDETWRAYCERCEVRAECLASAMSSPAIEGNWAGTTKRDRSKLRRSSKAA